MADAAEKLKGGMPEKHTTINENTDAHTDGPGSAPERCAVRFRIMGG